MQIKRERQVRLIRIWAVETDRAAGSAPGWTIDGTRARLEAGYVALRHTRQENEQLRELNWTA